MKLGVIVVNYNIEYYLQQRLESLQHALRGVEAEVFVVDNRSHDGSVAYLRSRFPDVHFIADTRDLDFAGGNNIAIRQSKGGYVLLLSPDTAVGEEVIHASIGFMDSHLTTGGHGAQMLTHCGGRALESRRGLPSPTASLYKMIGLYRHFSQSDHFTHYHMGSLSWDVSGKIEVISNVYCFLRRTALDKVGLLDEDFSMYGEDVDLSYRLLKGGFENQYLPVHILHCKGESTQESNFRHVHVFYDVMLIFFRKHYGGMNALWRLPIKTAIYVKAFGSLIGITIRATRKKLGFRTSKDKSFPHYIFVAGEDVIGRCQRLATDDTLVAEYRVADKDSLQHTHASLTKEFGGKNRPCCIVYGTDLSSYQNILNVFAEQPKQNIHIGFYHRKENGVITMMGVTGDQDMEKKQHVEIGLRAMEPGDLDMLYHVENDRSLWDVSAANVPYNRCALHSYIADAKNDIYIDGQLYVTTENHEQEVVGVIDLVNFSPKRQRTEIGIIIMKPFYQRGYVQAAISALIDYMRNRLHLKRIYTVADVGSEVPIRCLSLIGFTNGSILKEWLYCDRQYKDARVM